MTEVFKIESISNISSILKTLLIKFGNISGAELAKRTGIPTSTINRILAGTVLDPRISTLKPLAEYFGISVDQLLGFTALPFELSKNNALINPSKVIPIFDFTTYFYKETNPFRWFTWVTNNSEEDNAFALSINSEKFEPIFEKDTILIVEPKMLPPQQADFLLVIFEADNYLSIRRYHIEGKEHYFLPINTQLKATPVIEAEFTILGVITEAHTKMRSQE